MEKMKFNVDINAPASKVWNVLWDATSYPLWTNVFAEGSRAETDWQKGSKVLFVDNSNRGMVSRIVDNIPNQFMSIEHLGGYDNGVEDYESEQIKQWAGAQENYTLKETNGTTNLLVEMDLSGVDAKMIKYFESTWPKALQKVKELAEQ